MPDKALYAFRCILSSISNVLLQLLHQLLHHLLHLVTRKSFKTVGIHGVLIGSNAATKAPS